MRSPRLISLCALLALPPLAQAQDFGQPYSLGFELGVRSRNTWVPGNDNGSLEEWIGIRLRGSIVDPRLVTFSLAARPRFSQNHFYNLPQATGSHSRYLDLDAAVDVLRTRPLRASFQYTRTSFDDQGYGLYAGGQSTRNGMANAMVYYDNVLMPLRFNYRDEAWDLRTANPDGGGGPTRIQTLDFAGGNRKTSFDLTQTDNRNGGFTRLRLAEILNQQTWGKGSSLQLRGSAVSQSENNGFSLGSTALGGLLHLQHLRTVWSDWTGDWNRQRSSSPTGTSRSTARDLSGSLTWAVRPGFWTGISGNQTAVDFDAGLQRQFRIGPKAGFSAPLPRGVQLSGSAYVAYQRYHSTSAPGAVIVVVSERHSLDVGGSFQLDNPGVDLSSVVVRGTDGTLYASGVDYEVQETGGYVRILALPNGRLQPGQNLVVDYQHAPIPSIDAPALFTEYSADLVYRGLRLYHRRLLIDPGAQYRSVPSTSPVRVTENRNTGAQATIAAGRWNMTALAELQYRLDAGYEVNTGSVGGSVSTRLTTTLRAGLGGSYLRAKGSTGASERLGGQVQLTWLPYPGVQLTTAVMDWRTINFGDGRESQVGAAAGVVWQPGLLRAAIFYDYRGYQNQALPGSSKYSVPTHNLVAELSRTF